MKFLENFVELIYWCLICISPTLLFGFVGLVLYHHYGGNNVGIMLLVLLSTSGLGCGIYFAERIRRTVGCANFMTRTSWADQNKKDKEPRQMNDN